MTTTIQARMTHDEAMEAFDYLAQHPDVAFIPPYHGIGCGAFTYQGDYMPTNSVRIAQLAAHLKQLENDQS